LFLFEDAVTMLRWCVFVEKPILESLRYWTLSAPDRYPRGFTGHVAHPSRSILQRELDEAMLLCGCTKLIDIGRWVLVACGDR